MDPIWRGGFPVYVPTSRVKEATELLDDVRSTARPILPRAIAIVVLVVFLGPAIVTAIGWLAGSLGRR